MEQTVLRRWSTAVLLAAGCTFGLSGGCATGSGKEAADEKSKKSQAAEESDRASSKAKGGGDGVFSYALVDDPETFDTAKMSGAPEGRVAFNLFEGLLMPAKTTEGAESSKDLVRPGVAEDWSKSDDGTTYTFHLREDARWSNGEPVTADDFRFAWRRILTPGFPADYGHLFHVIENAEAYSTGRLANFDDVGIVVKDDRTLVVRLRNAVPYFPELVSFYPFFPQPKSVVEEHGENWTRPKHIVTNGAYTLDGYRANERIELAKNENYWGADDVSIGEARLEIADDRRQVVEMYRNGELDWTGSNLPISQIEKLQNHDDYRSEPLLGIYYVRLNVKGQDSPLAKPKVRRALSLTVDREKIVEDALNGVYSAANGFVPETMSGYESKVELTRDVERAKRLLKEAGHPEGKGIPTVEILYNSEKVNRIVVSALQQQWESELGIDVSLKGTTWQTYLKRIDNLDYQVARAGWIGDYNDPMTFLGIWTSGSGNNDTGWANETYDKLITEARGTTDPAKRKELLQRAEKMLVEKGPVIPLYEYTNQMLLSKNVQGFAPHNRNIHQLRDLSLDH